MAKSEEQIRKEVYEEFGNVNACAKLFYELVREEQHLKKLQDDFADKKAHYANWREKIIKAGGMGAELLKEATHIDLMSESPLTASEVKSSGVRKRISKKEREDASDSTLKEFKSKKTFTRGEWEKVANNKLDTDSGSASWNDIWKSLQVSKAIVAVNKTTSPHQYKVGK